VTGDLVTREADSMVICEVDSASGTVFEVGVITASGAVALLAQAAVTVLSDAAVVAELRQALDWAAAEQARIHRELYPGGG
jgi:nucleoside 2-deoxyribosyltransferase